MAKILKFPERRRPVVNTTGFIGVRLDEVLEAIRFQALEEDDQTAAFDLLFQLAELDELEEYVGITSNLEGYIKIDNGEE